MAAKSKAAKKRRGTPPPPVAYHIKVNVDLHGKFTYTASGIPDASTIRPRNNDTIVWSVTFGGFPISFQVEFPGYGPFGAINRVVRSVLGATPPQTVNVPSYYKGNMVFKYTVTIANGWSDDPDVEPVPANALNADATPQVISLSVDANSGVLSVDKPNAQFTKGEVTWQWAGDKLDDFTLTFDPIVPPGWPPQTASQSGRLALDMETPGTQTYTIQTLHLGLSSSGNQLKIS
jgi:hypothetical protein